MFIKPRFFRVISIFCLIFSMAILSFADTIRLKDGSIIKGKIVRFDGGKFTVLIDDGARQRTLNFNAEEVESIVFDANPLPISNTDTTNISPPNIKTEGNSTIITVGQKEPPQTDLPENNSTITDVPPTDSNDTPTKPEPNTTVISAKPITLNLQVFAETNKIIQDVVCINNPQILDKVSCSRVATSNGWTNSGWVVRKGQKIRIKGSGRVSLGNGRYASPDGISTLPDNEKLIKDQPTGGLIAVIGADNNEFIFIGDSTEFIATRDGDLFLGVNEGNLTDNSGAFDVTIEIDPTTGN